MNFRQIKETCIYVKDLRTTEKFYSEVLGLEKIASVEDRHVFFRAGTSVLLFFNSDKTRYDDHLPPHYGCGHLHFALEIPRSEYDSTKQKIEEVGIVVEHEHLWRDDIRSFYFRDPDGHLLEVVPEGMWDL